MTEYRLYYECIEQAEYFKEMVNTYENIVLHLVRRQKDYQLYSKKIAPIVYWKDADLLFTVIKDNIEYPLLLIELSTAEFTADHELQRFDGLVAAVKNNCIYVKISPNSIKSKKGSHGGDTKFNYLTPYAVGLQYYNILNYHFNWEIEDEKLLLHEKYLTCLPKLPQLTILIDALINYINKNLLSNQWLKDFQSRFSQIHEWVSTWQNKVENTKIATQQTLNSTRTLWSNEENALYLKINRFGHAMDPERGMLAFYGTLYTTKCRMSFNTTLNTWYSGTASEKSIQKYIDKIGLHTTFDFLFIFGQASGLGKYDYFDTLIRQYKQTNTLTLTIDITHFVQAHFVFLNKPLKTIFLYSNHWQIEDNNKIPRLIFTWQKPTLYAIFENYKDVTKIEVKHEFEEDEVTYISIHNILRPNQYTIIASSFPGAQGDRAILLEAGTGRGQSRTFIDIIAHLPNKHTALQENKAIFQKDKLQSDINKLIPFKSSLTHQNALDTFFEKYSGNSPRLVKIGIGFWANKKFTVSDIQLLNIDKLDYFIYINDDRTKWRIFSTGHEQMFNITEGEVNLPIRFKIS
jgi:hypothetical protein